jgi:glucose-6-phosphate 1-dehydrogenase
MKIIKDEPATLKRGRRITLELVPGETVGCIKEGHYYRLGGQVDDIVQSHVIAEMRCVYWCSITQKWEEA